MFTGRVHWVKVQIQTGYFFTEPTMHTPSQAPTTTRGPLRAERWLGLGLSDPIFWPLMPVLLSLGLAAVAQAQTTSNNFLLYSIAGSTGLGLGVAKEMRNGLILRAEITELNKSIQTSQDGIDYRGKIQLASSALYADWHPFDSSFHLSTGLNIKPTQVTLGANSNNGLITLNGQSYPLSSTQELRATLSFPTFMPYLGLGWGFEHLASSSGFGFNTDFGFDFGKMNANLSTTPDLSALPGFKDNLSAQSQKLNASVSNLRFFPVVKFQLGYAY